MAALLTEHFDAFKKIIAQHEVLDAIYNWQWPTVLITFLVCYTAYYLIVVVKKPKLITCKDGWLRKSLEENLRTMHELYWPTFWCFSAPIITICRVIFKRKPSVAYRRQHCCCSEQENCQNMIIIFWLFSLVLFRAELLETPDGGITSLDWLDNDEDNQLFPDAAKRPTVILMPGLTGCSEASYCRHLVLTAKEMGMRTVVMNNRGFGRDVVLKTPRTFCANNTDDLKFVLKHIASLFPESPVFGTGISLGGLIMSHWLAQVGKTQSQMVGAFIVSVPWNSFQSTLSLEKPLNWLLFNRHLTQKLLTMLNRNLNVFEQHLHNLPYELEHVLKAKSIREFDDRFTSKTFGYRDCEEYYSAASLDAAPLENISVPTLFLNSEDDPFAPGHSIPQQAIKKNSSLALLLTQYGGHIGFIDGFFVRSQSIVEKSFMQFSKMVLERQSQATS
eukprot:Seg1786.5 transcript_id=Seg1786.5/GoldUCD/mRNA.D3Y31 product="Phospholipase ABHD3" protein_id=Seg1786.5/GoldUCD/D3Y31